MSYTLARNLKVNEKTGVISGEFAESNVTDWNGKRIYEYAEDIYNNKEGSRTSEEKFSRFIYDIQSGNLQGSLGKWGKLNFSNYYKDQEFFRAKYPDKDPFVLTYEKYKPAIEKVLNEKDKYIIKFSNDTYLKKLNQKTYHITYNREEAKRYSLSSLSNIKRVFPDSEVVNIETGATYKIKDYQISTDLNPKSEIEQKYVLKIPMLKDSFKEAQDKISSLETAIKSFSNKDLDSNTIKDFYNKQIEEILKGKALFGFAEKESPLFVTRVYPELVKSKYKDEEQKNPNFYIGYRIICNDLVNGYEKTYEPDSMSCMYLLGNEIDTMSSLIWKEAELKKEVEDLLKKQEEEEEDEESL